MPNTQNSPYYAALDLGSNSFHLIIVKVTESGIQAVDKVKHMVRLGEGLKANGHLDDNAFKRGIEALSQMQQLIQHIPPEQVRAVGTNTLRIAKNGKRFLTKGQAALGIPIEIISGVEEARLIYIGITRHNHFKDHNIIIDVGGGSTEVIAGNGIEPVILRSFKMGCANMGQSFFPKGKISQSAVDKAIEHAGQIIAPSIKTFKKFNPQRVILSSGTAKSIERILDKLEPEHDGVSQQGINHLLAKLIDIGKADKLAKKLGIDSARAFGFTGGVCILAAIFDWFNIKQAVVSQEALREGVLLDLMGRSDGEIGERRRTVSAFQKRFTIDEHQANSVSNLAQTLDRQLPHRAPTHLAPMLEFAAQLHEIGLAISHNSHYNHGAYILANADMPGFSTQLEHVVSLLVKGQRRKPPQEAIDKLPKALRPYTWQACFALRLAVLLMRSRAPIAEQDYPIITHQANHIHLQFNQAFLDARPLTVADLEDEQTLLADASPYVLTFVGNKQINTV